MSLANDIVVEKYWGWLDFITPRSVMHLNYGPFFIPSRHHLNTNLLVLFIYPNEVFQQVFFFFFVFRLNMMYQIILYINIEN
jgi:hypothetical protein